MHSGVKAGRAVRPRVYLTQRVLLYQSCSMSTPLSLLLAQMGRRRGQYKPWRNFGAGMQSCRQIGRSEGRRMCWDLWATHLLQLA